MSVISGEIDFDNNIYDTIKQNIRRYRKEKGITSAEFAETTGFFRTLPCAIASLTLVALFESRFPFLASLLI